jgi:hypothetical protein
MVPSPHESDEKPLRIRRGRVESVDLYEIKDSELDLFQKGSPADLQLNFAIFLLSIAFTAIVALCTATFTSANIHTTFIVIAVVGLLFGIYLLIAWMRNRSSLAKTCDGIRNRIKEPDLVIAATQTVVTTLESSEPKE